MGGPSQKYMHYSRALGVKIAKLQAEFGRPEKKAGETIADHQKRVKAWEVESGYAGALDLAARELQVEYGFMRDGVLSWEGARAE